MMSHLPIRRGWGEVNYIPSLKWGYIYMVVIEAQY